MRGETLHYGNIARSAGESVAPELWPDHAWVPALGCTGGSMPGFGGIKIYSSSAATNWSWGPKSLNFINSGNVNAWTTGGHILPVGLSRFTVISSLMYTSIGLRWWFSQIASTDACGSASWIDTLGRLNVGVWGPKAQSAAGTVVANEPTILAMTRNGTAVAGYKNGVLVADGTSETSVEDTSAQFTLGERHSKTNTALSFCGEYYSCCTYNRVLSPTSISYLSADPLLPFRRRRLRSWFLPAAGGGTILPFMRRYLHA